MKESIIFEYLQTLKGDSQLSCACSSLADIDVIDMGDEHDDMVFATLELVKSYGMPLWWLDLYKCTECHQSWLVAQEDRHNDIICLKKLTSDEENNIIYKNNWPKYFQTFEELLELAKKHGRYVEFFYLEDSLVDSAIDLAKSRPGISVKEIASLLHLADDVAYKVCKLATDQESIEIKFS